MKPGNKVLAILNDNISVIKIDGFSYLLKNYHHKKKKDHHMDKHLAHVFLA